MFATLQKTVAVIGTPVQLSADQPITSGIPIVLKAKVANGGTITVGNSSANALNSGSGCFRLEPGQALEFTTDNLSRVWIDATIALEGVEVLYEPIA